MIGRVLGGIALQFFSLPTLSKRYHYKLVQLFFTRCWLSLLLSGANGLLFSPTSC